MPDDHISFIEIMCAAIEVAAEANPDVRRSEVEVLKAHLRRRAQRDNVPAEEVAMNIVYMYAGDFIDLLDGTAEQVQKKTN
jgi:hypothetical protein